MSTARTPDAGAVAQEARRQAALLDAIGDASCDATALALRGDSAQRAAGLAAYRGNAAMLAERALAAVYPTVVAMLGAETFGHLSRAFWRAHPPVRGDLGEWGDGFAEALGANPALAEWPYLADGARLDLAVHRCERAADALFDGASLGRLESEDPARLQVRLMPGSAALASAWPIATIHAAHRGADRDFSAARAAIAARSGESVLVVRDGWRAVVHRIDRPTFEWTRRLLDGASLGDALDAASPGFDFGAWLPDAVRARWLRDVVVRPD
jgi:hypothetical protein